MGKTTRLDDDGIWLARELETIESRVFDKIYTDITYQDVVPVDTTTIAATSDTYTYRMRDRVGKFKRMQDRETAPPRVDVTRKEVSHKLVSYTASYGYGILEVRAARSEGKDLQAERVDALRRAYEETAQDLAYLGDSDAGIEGFFNNSNVDKLNITQTWFSTNATTDEMLKILNSSINYMLKSTKMVERPNTILMALDDYEILRNTPRSSTSDTTVLQYFLQNNNQYITDIRPMNELDDYVGANKNRMILYNRNPDKLRCMIPQVLETLPPERKGMEYEVAAHARFGGTIVYYPKSILYVDQQTAG